jgi:hypothetical protein
MYLEAIQRIGKKHDTIALHIADPKEYHAPERGFIQFFNAETSTTTWMNMSDPKVREKLQEFESEKIAELTQNMLRAGVNLVSFKTNEEIRLPLLRLFKNRS